ncbi:hypothetical protein [Nocardia sp. NPDC050710]|uniref:hypothetical protein n=1 Tax=Nocardia sp. NPDC050710 TaxID=3157220 RepID=UPI0033E2B069
MARRPGHRDVGCRARQGDRAVRNVVWCTGFDKDTAWIEIPITGDDGWPEQQRGVVASSPGLYFVGLPFQYAFASVLIGGVGRDAERVARHIARRTAAGIEMRSERGRSTGFSGARTAG